MNVNGVVTNDQKVISNYCYEFYKKIYASNNSQTISDAFLNSIQVKVIDINDCELCDMPISDEEVIKTIYLLKNNKSTGTDGLTAEFYKQFTKELAPQFPSPTLTQGLIKLLPKPNS